MVFSARAKSDFQMASFRHAVSQLWNLNLFTNVKTEHETDDQVLQFQLRTSRIYVCLLITTLIIMTVFTTLAPVNVSITVQKPSLETYKYLQSIYHDALSCPCEHTAVSYDDFFSITPNYHQVGEYLGI